MEHHLGSPIAGMLGTTDFVLSIGFDDLGDDLARRRGRSGHGASMAWQLGHLLHYRHLMLDLLGMKRHNPYEELFGKKGATLDERYPTVAEFRTAWRELSAALVPTVAKLTAAELTRPVPGRGAHGEQTVMDKLLFYVWHEGYHTGQLGALRVEFGLPAFSTLVAEQAKSAAAPSAG